MISRAAGLCNLWRAAPHFLRQFAAATEIGPLSPLAGRAHASNKSNWTSSTSTSNSSTSNSNSSTSNSYSSTSNSSTSTSYCSTSTFNSTSNSTSTITCVKLFIEQISCFSRRRGFVGKCLRLATTLRWVISNVTLCHRRPLPKPPPADKAPLGQVRSEG